MARKSSKPPEVRHPTLQMRRSDAENRIQARIEEGRQLLERPISNEADLKQARAERRKWSDYNRTLLRMMLDTGDLVRDYDGIGVGTLAGTVRAPLQQRVIWFKDDLRSYITRLESILERLELYPETPEVTQPDGQPQIASLQLGNRVFVVHGHDEEAKQAVARCIEKLGLEAVILHEQVSQGRTIIEKFEDYSDVGFAVVLLTPDDVGASKEHKDNLHPRARQNVIFELGFFIGKLGRQRVCALHRGDVEIPSDFVGVLWVPLDPNGAWRLALAGEMRAAGFDVDLNLLA